MKIIITEQQANELLTSMLEEMFDGYEIKFEGDYRNVYVNGKLMAQLGPSSAIVSLDAFNELKDNLFFSSDKDLREEVASWVRDKFKAKSGIAKYGVSFKKLHGKKEIYLKNQKNLTTQHVKINWNLISIYKDLKKELQILKQDYKIKKI